MRAKSSVKLVLSSRNNLCHFRREFWARRCEDNVSLWIRLNCQLIVISLSLSRGVTSTTTTQQTSCIFLDCLLTLFRCGVRVWWIIFQSSLCFAAEPGHISILWFLDDCVECEKLIKFTTENWVLSCVSIFSLHHGFGGLVFTLNPRICQIRLGVYFFCALVVVNLNVLIIWTNERNETSEKRIKSFQHHSKQASISLMSMLARLAAEIQQFELWRSEKAKKNIHNIKKMSKVVAFKT